ncbi:MAG TPA: lysylphosphatidylglycerol synthase transmembrane domain-containing protein [Gaiellaceae bacterium]|nr:lysylphosphatidylglycerol synthase transmembrane domain-containing protein [Gaiellaceae bacterium]
MGDFFHAVRVFGDHLAAVRWEFLALALAFHLARLVFRSLAWRAILSAAYPDARPKLLSTFGAYVAGVGVNSVAPARAGDVVKLYLIKHRIADSRYSTLAPTLVAETLLDFFVGLGLMIWALSLGVLPTHEVYSRLPSVDWGFFLRHERWTAIVLAFLLAAGVIGFIVFLEKGDVFRERVGRGFAILRTPSRFATRVALPQAISWALRVGSVYYFLEAFDVHASIHNALLAMVVDSLATLFPATPGGAGTKQGLIVFLFRGQAVTTSALLAFSVGMNIATVACNVVVGSLALLVMARTLSWKRIRAAQAKEAA